MLLSFPGKSHGLGPPYGLEDIELEDPRFAVEVTLMPGKALWVPLARTKGWEEPSHVPALSSWGKLALAAALLASVLVWRRAMGPDSR